MNPADMVAALNVPEAKLAKRALDSAAQRVVTLKELLGTRARHRRDPGGAARGLRRAPRASRRCRARSPREEEALAAQYHDEEIGTDAFVAEIDDPGATRRRALGQPHRRRAARSPPTSASRGRSATASREVLDHRRLLRHAAAHRVRPRGGAARTCPVARAAARRSSGSSREAQRGPAHASRRRISAPRSKPPLAAAAYTRDGDARPRRPAHLGRVSRPHRGPPRGPGHPLPYYRPFTDRRALPDARRGARRARAARRRAVGQRRRARRADADGGGHARARVRSCESCRSSASGSARRSSRIAAGGARAAHRARVRGDRARGASTPTRSTATCRSEYPLVIYMRDRPVPPAGRADPRARTRAAARRSGRSARTRFGFAGHPGLKVGDGRGPDHGVRRGARRMPGPGSTQLRAAQRAHRGRAGADHDRPRAAHAADGLHSLGRGAYCQRRAVYIRVC